MRNVQSRVSGSPDLRRRIERLDALPLRPATARFILDGWPDEPDETFLPQLALDHWGPTVDLDPGWVLNRSRKEDSRDALTLVAESPWWSPLSRESSDALGRIWRHDLAVSLAARRLAREAGDSDPDQVARAGFLHGLGRWVVSAIDPDWLPRWLAIPEPLERRFFEIQELGTDLDVLGRSCAERWGCDRLVADANWLSGPFDRGLESACEQPERIKILRQARRLAARTPWTLAVADHREMGDQDPRVKLMIAEVQSRAPSNFVEGDASSREERLTRSNAKLLNSLMEAASRSNALSRFAAAFSQTAAAIGPDSWADRAGIALCSEPGVSSARVNWLGGTAVDRAEGPDPDAPPGRPPSISVPLGPNAAPQATLDLWLQPGHAAVPTLPGILPAWSAWAALIAEREAVGRRLGEVHHAYRRQVEDEEPRIRRDKLEALAEFAAGAGHELNNPLAVIVGRAQLLLVNQTDPKTIRSLRAILTQAQRSHRILRDLMYVARPAEPRPRFCLPDEIMRNSLRDARQDADGRGVALIDEVIHPVGKVWADPDALRHVADALVRNALEASPRGGCVRFSTDVRDQAILWSVVDKGRGVAPAGAGHLFDPFYCGREAGRNLGLGLPRLARYVDRERGEVRWTSKPGQGSCFSVRLPINPPPKPFDPTGDGPHPPLGPGDA